VRGPGGGSGWVVPLERGDQGGSNGVKMGVWLWVLRVAVAVGDGALFFVIFLYFFVGLSQSLYVCLGEWQWQGGSESVGKRRSMRFEWCQNHRVAVAIDRGSGSRNQHTHTHIKSNPHITHSPLKKPHFPHQKPHFPIKKPIFSPQNAIF
jgi:hypothetical protein